VVAVTLPTNQGSQQVMTKIGMHFERGYNHAGLPHVLFRITFADSGGVA
jgi:RimJ/RimL family protein N-acetyltransferase